VASFTYLGTAVTNQHSRSSLNSGNVQNSLIFLFPIRSPKREKYKAAIVTASRFEWVLEQIFLGRLRWVGYVAGMRDINSYRILIGKV
jgi:hypothetical protein